MSSYEQHPWFVHLLGKLLEGDRSTLHLLKTDPFPDRPPRYVRAQLYEYAFTNPVERSANGMWWKRKVITEYFPPVSLQDGPFRNLLERQGWLEPEPDATGFF